MKTIRFKEPFESKLKKMKIKTKFIHNLRYSCLFEENKTMKDKVTHLNSITGKYSWLKFINAAFEWNDTSEGYYVWQKIAETDEDFDF